MKNPLVSVIVTTKNSERTLQKCVTSVKNQTYKHIELIVVDNNSTDKTTQIAKLATKHVFNTGPERSSQRNFAIQKSKGAFILFLDSDMSLSPNVVKECVQTIQDQEIEGIYIPEIIAGNSFWAKMRTFERSFYNATVIDAIRFVRKKTAEEIGGFDETLFAGEDWDFDIRLRAIGKTASIKASLFHHEEDTNIFSYLKKKSYYSDNLKLYRAKWRDNVDVAKQFSPAYRFFGVFVEKEKWKKIIAYPHLFFCVIVLKCFVGLQFVLTKPKHSI